MPVGTYQFAITSHGITAAFTIQTTGSYPLTAVSKYTTWNTLTLNDNLQAYIWNYELSEEQKSSYDMQLKAFALNNAVNLVDQNDPCVVGYRVSSCDYDYEKDNETGVIKSITLSNLCYQADSWRGTVNSYHGNSVMVVLPDCTFAGPFKLTFENNVSGN